MKKRFFRVLFSLILIFTIILISSGCKKNSEKEDFSFVFMTDIHLTTDLNAVPGFNKAIEKVNDLNPDFVITGGDLIMDALGVSYAKADSAYNLFISTSGAFKMPVYNTMGNHEIFGIYAGSGADESNPEYGEKMFEKRLGKLYYSFDHKNWKFFILNSPEVTKENRYVGLIDDDQIEWIKEELQRTDTLTPIVISTHIPFLTVRSQRYAGSTVANDPGEVVTNSRQVLDLFKRHNLRLVLQGHLHTFEDIYIDDVHYITGGAVSANWWKGPRDGEEEGFLYITVQGDDFRWKYIDYGWEAK